MFTRADLFKFSQPLIYNPVALMKPLKRVILTSQLAPLAPPPRSIRLMLSPTLKEIAPTSCDINKVSLCLCPSFRPHPYLSEMVARPRISCCISPGSKMCSAMRKPSKISSSVSSSLPSSHLTRPMFAMARSWTEYTDALCQAFFFSESSIPQSSFVEHHSNRSDCHCVCTIVVQRFSQVISVRK